MTRVGVQRGATVSTVTPRLRAYSALTTTTVSMGLGQPDGWPTSTQLKGKVGQPVRGCPVERQRKGAGLKPAPTTTKTKFSSFVQAVITRTSETSGSHPAVATHRTVTETHDISMPGVCDLCRQGAPAYTYQGRTPVSRHNTTETTIVDYWTETRWEVCRSCSMLVDDRDRYQLCNRMINMGYHSQNKVTYKIVVGFFENLIRGSKREIKPRPTAAAGDPKLPSSTATPSQPPSPGSASTAKTKPGSR